MKYATLMMLVIVSAASAQPKSQVELVHEVTIKSFQDLPGRPAPDVLALSSDGKKLIAAVSDNPLQKRKGVLVVYDFANKKEELQADVPGGLLSGPLEWKGDVLTFHTIEPKIEGKAIYKKHTLDLKTKKVETMPANESDVLTRTFSLGEVKVEMLKEEEKYKLRIRKGDSVVAITSLGQLRPDKVVSLPKKSRIAALSLIVVENEKAVGFKGRPMQSVLEEWNEKGEPLFSEYLPKSEVPKHVQYIDDRLHAITLTTAGVASLKIYRRK
jgi:hypothetical protein